MPLEKEAEENQDQYEPKPKKFPKLLNTMATPGLIEKDID